MRQYGVYALLAISLLMNVFMFITRPRGHRLETELAPEFKRVARSVTQHLLDTSYTTFGDYTLALEKEIAPPTVKTMKQRGLLPRSDKEAKAQEMTFRQQGRVCSVRIDSVEQQQSDPNGLVPVVVSGVTVVHSADGVEENPFKFMFKMGLVGGDDEQKKVMVASFQEMKAEPQL